MPKSWPRPIRRRFRAEREWLALELARRVAAGVSGEELFAAALGELALWRAGERRERRAKR